MIISDLNHLEVVENETRVVGSGGVSFDSVVNLDKDIDIDIDADVTKDFDISVSGVEGNSAEASAGSDAFGNNTFSDAVAFAQSGDDHSQSFAEAIAVTG